MPLVSVVLAVRNGDAFLDEAIASIRAQTLSDLELIAVDDGSTDGTQAILARHAHEDGRIRVYHRQERGLVPALNDGVLLAQGTYLARMDDDDVALGDRLDRQVTELQNRPDVGVIGGWADEIDAQGRVLRRIETPVEVDELRKHMLTRNNGLIHSTVCARTDAIRQAGGYRSVFPHAEDYDLWLRIGDTARVANLPQVVMRVRNHANRMSYRHAEQQVLSAVGARVAAQMRVAGEGDPAEGWRGIVHGLPDELKLDRATLNREMTAGLAGLLNQAAHSSDIALARDICLILRRYGTAQSAWQVEADYLIRAARTALKVGKVKNAFALGVLALRQDSGAIFRALACRSVRGTST